jgi:putative thioredoxin
MTSFDVTDATFQADVIERSQTTPVVVDLWAPWCGPCKQLGPILEKVVDATDGQVVLAKINVDENPGASQAFRVQSIPAVYAVAGGQVVDGFIGAQGEAAVAEFVQRLLPEGAALGAPDPIDEAIAAGNEAYLRQVLESEPGNERAIVGLAELMVERNANEEALALLERIPESGEAKRVAALARTGEVDDVEAELDQLLGRVKGDEEARQRFVDLLEVMGAEDPRTAQYRKRLTAALF